MKHGNAERKEEKERKEMEEKNREKCIEIFRCDATYRLPASLLLVRPVFDRWTTELMGRKGTLAYNVRGGCRKEYFDILSLRFFQK